MTLFLECDYAVSILGWDMAKQCFGFGSAWIRLSLQDSNPDHIGSREATREELGYSESIE
jgi:hypothetical protein